MANSSPCASDIHLRVCGDNGWKIPQPFPRIQRFGAGKARVQVSSQPAQHWVVLKCVTARMIDFRLGHFGAGVRGMRAMRGMGGLGDLAVQALAAGVGGLEAEHMSLEFAHAADMLFDHHLKQGFDLLLLLMNADAQLLVELNDGAEGAADIGIGNRRNIHLRLRGCIGHNELHARERCENSSGSCATLSHKRRDCDLRAQTERDICYHVVHRIAKKTWENYCSDYVLMMITYEQLSLGV